MSYKWVFIPFLLIAFLLIGGNVVFAYARINSCMSPGNAITINGSTALAPLITDVAKDYQHRCPFVKVSVNNGAKQGSATGISQVEQGTINIGTSDIFADTTQNPDLHDYQVAVVVFALVVNTDVSVSTLTTNQVRRIYSGDITNWSVVDLHGQNREIVRISRPPSSGTRATFEKYILNGIETVPGPQSLISDTSDDVAKYVKTQPGAIGYVSLYHAKKYGLKIVSIDNISPTDSQAVRNGPYVFWNVEHMYTKGVATGLTKDFIEHMYSDIAKPIVTDDSYLSIFDFTRDALFRHISQI